MEGIVGPFLIEENASLDIKRSIYSMDDKKIEKDKNGVYSISGNKFKIKYEVNPKPIEGVAVEKVNVSNVILETTLPKGLQYANPLENLITDGLRSQNKIDISSILYEYNSKENISYPKTQGSSYTHTIEIKEFGEYTLSEADSVLSYLESDGSKKEYRFDSEKISMSQETQVIKSGLYDEKINDFKQPQRVTSLMPITLATDISVKSSNPSIEFNMSSLNGDSYDLNKYELDGNNNIIKSSVQTKKIKGNSFKIESSNDFKLDINKKYRLIYKVRPDNGDKFYVNVKNETGESKTVVQLDVFELPIIK